MPPLTVGVVHSKVVIMLLVFVLLPMSEGSLCFWFCNVVICVLFCKQVFFLYVLGSKSWSYHLLYCLTHKRKFYFPAVIGLGLEWWGWRSETGSCPPVKYFDRPFRSGTSFVDHFCYLCLVFVMLSHLFIAVSWSPSGKGLTSWLSFEMFKLCFCHFSMWYPGSGVAFVVSIPDLCPLSYLGVPALQWLVTVQQVYPVTTYLSCESWSYHLFYCLAHKRMFHYSRCRHWVRGTSLTVTSTISNNTTGLSCNYLPQL